MCFFLYMLIYISAINIFGFIVMWMDKQKAKQKLWRFKEITLFFLSLVGGSLGVWIGMYVFHHKTNKMHFKDYNHRKIHAN